MTQTQHISDKTENIHVKPETTFGIMTKPLIGRCLQRRYLSCFVEELILFSD
jgi:hypothetical protein